MATGYTTVSATKLSDSSGNLISNAVITFTPCSTSGAPISFQVGGGGQASNAPVSAPVTNGAFSIQLADTTLTEPQNVCYRVQVQGRTFSAGIPPVQLLGPGYLIQPSGATWSLDGFVPNLATLALIQTGPQGPQGLPGTLSGNYTGPLSVSPLTVGSQAVLLDTPSSSSGYVDAVVDKNGNVQSGIHASGRQDINAGLTVKGGLVADTFSTQVLSGTELDANKSYIGQQAVDIDTPSNPSGFVYALTDRQGKVGIGLDAAGDFYAGGNLRTYGNTISMSRPNVTVDSAPLALSSAQAASLGASAMNVFLVTGQSLSNGQYSIPPISTTQHYGNLMLNGGVRDGIGEGQVAPTSGLTSLVPLIEQQDPTSNNGEPMGQTICSSMGDVVALELAKRGYVQPGVWALSGCNGTGYTGIDKGTQTFNNLVTYLTSIKSLASGTLIVRSLSLIHGENDDYASNPYAADIIQMQSDYQAAIQAVTGQSQTVPLQLCQQNSWTAYHSSAVPYDAQQQLAACEQSPLVLFVTPKYFLYTASNGGGVHLSAVSEYLLGEYHGKCAAATLAGQTWTGLRPRPGFPVRTGKQVFIDFYVPVGPLVLDTTLVTQPTNVPGGMYGFETAYINSDGSTSTTAGPAIIAVAIIGKTTVKLTLASAPAPPTGATFRVRYAFTGVVGASAGPLTGARGNLRDSDYYPSNYDGRPLFNWCAAFDKPCS